MSLATALPLLVGGPLLAAFVVPMTGRWPVVRRAVGLGVPAVVLVYAGFLIAATRNGDVLVEQVAGWQAGIAIPFAADLFSALMLAVASLLILVTTSFAIATGDDRDRYFMPLVLAMSAGVYGAFVTADVFNLFVVIEVALIPSYVLMTRSGRAAQLTAGRLYLTMSLGASTIFLIGVGLLYGVTGTVNLGELAGVGAESPAAGLAAGVILVALAVKAAVVPVHSWLPRTYPHASPAVTALFSGLLTKIGVYAIFRLYAVIFGGDERLHTLLLVVLVATMVVGVLGALGQTTMRSILAFHMVSQVGYILLGLAFFGPLGVAAGIFYLLHHTIVKASLFLSTGAVETVHGTGRLAKLGGVARQEPVLAVAFVLAALSLTGIPPLSGFVAKFALIRAAVIEQQFLAAGVAVAVSLFTLLSMLKVWNAVFWGPTPEEPTDPADGPPHADEIAGAENLEADLDEPLGDEHADDPDPPAHVLTRGGRRRMRAGLVAPAAVLAAISVALGLGGEGLLALAEQAAAGLVDVSTYVAAVTGR